MNAIRVQQLCRGLADSRTGTLRPKCHFPNCFQLCSDLMEEIGKRLDVLIETWTITHDIDYGGHLPEVYSIQCD